MSLKVWLALLLALLAAPAGAGDQLNLRVSPEVSFAPSNLTVRATVEKHAGNRALEIVAESEEFFRSSEVPLDGERSPRVTMFAFRQVPAGAYEIRGRVIGVAGETRASARMRVMVMSAGGDR